MDADDKGGLVIVGGCLFAGVVAFFAAVSAWLYWLASVATEMAEAVVVGLGNSALIYSFLLECFVACVKWVLWNFVPIR